MDIAIDLTREALLVAAKIALPALAVALLVGIVVSMLQSATQIHDPAVSIVPKLIAVVVTLLLLLPWMLSVLTEYAARAMREMGGAL
jgi:flagellar biosynthetic protein FliQ